MPEEPKVPRLQEQINRVEEIIYQNPLRMFVTGVVGGGFLAVLGFFWATMVIGGWRDIRWLYWCFTCFRTQCEKGI